VCPSVGSPGRDEPSGREKCRGPDGNLAAGVKRNHDCPEYGRYHFARSRVESGLGFEE
jgi:hypothetical protein